MRADSAPALEDAADVRGLAGVLEIVDEHAHQSDAEGDRRVPPLVDDTIEVGVTNLPDELDGVLVDGVVVCAEQLPRPR